MGNYPGFWRRFLAWLIDSAIVLFGTLCLLPINSFAQSRLSLELYSGFYLVTLMINPAYHIITQGRWGWTLGKKIMGIKLCMKDETPVLWTAVVIRYLPIIVYNLIWAVGWTTAASWLRVDLFREASFAERTRYIIEVAPAWWNQLHWLISSWFIVNAIVLCSSVKNRALHDFISGTLVCYAKERMPFIKLQLKGPQL